MSTPDYALLDALLMPVFVLEPDSAGNLIYVAWNRTAAEISTVPSSDVLGKTARELYPDRLGALVYRRHIQCFRTGEVQEYEIPVMFHDKQRFIRTTLVPTKDGFGRVIRLTGTSVDLTDEMELRQQAIDAEAHHQLMTEEMETFISLAAHDLRTPMLHVQNIAGMLRTGFQDHGDGKVELIDMLETVGVKASELITSVLNHARSNSAKPVLRTLDAGQLCANIFAALDPHDHHELMAERIMIHVEGPLLQIIIRNLVDNAIKHANEAAVRVSVLVTAQDDKWLTVSVQDNGGGMQDYDRAFRAEGFQPSSGYGLFGVKRLVHARGGSISAAPTPAGDGTIVTATIPGTVVPG